MFVKFLSKQILFIVFLCMHRFRLKYFRHFDKDGSLGLFDNKISIDVSWKDHVSAMAVCMEDMMRPTSPVSTPFPEHV